MDIEDNLPDLLLEQLAVIPEWMEHAACKETKLDPYFREHTEEFKELCQDCPVLQECEQKFATFHEDVRAITCGVFHGKDYEGDT